MAIRIVVWNCNMALHTKVERLLSLRPDIAVVPECAEPDIIRKKAPGLSFADCEWTGAFEHKGLGVFSFNGLTLRRHQSWERSFHLFIPVEVRGREVVNLLAVWAFNRTGTAVEPNPSTTGDAIRYYRPFLKAAPPVVAGDFNANVKWDATGKYTSFAEVDGDLRTLGLTSAYHGIRAHAHGDETDPTLLLQKNAQKSYHIDYVYLPTTWLPRVHTLEVGAPGDWLALSDHVPLVVDVEPAST